MRRALPLNEFHLKYIPRGYLLQSNSVLLAMMANVCFIKRNPIFSELFQHIHILENRFEFWFHLD